MGEGTYHETNKLEQFGGVNMSLISNCFDRIVCVSYILFERVRMRTTFLYLLYLFVGNSWDTSTTWLNNTQTMKLYQTPHHSCQIRQANNYRGDTLIRFCLLQIALTLLPILCFLLSLDTLTFSRHTNDKNYRLLFLYILNLGNGAVKYQHP